MLQNKIFDADLIWYVARTKPRSENIAKEHLTRQGYQVYLPLLKVFKRARRKQFATPLASLEPMFPSYIFCAPKNWEHSISPIRSTMGISNMVCFGGKPVQIISLLLNQIQELEQKQNNADFETLCAVQAGMKVQIDHGPFAGLEGLVSRVAKDRVFVLLDLLGRETSVNFSLTELVAA